MNLAQQIKSWLPHFTESKTPRYQQIAQVISNAIHNGQILIGEKLPTHRTLACILKVTPSTISHAYELLAAEGKVIPRIGDGTYVQILQTSHFSLSSKNSESPIKKESRVIDLAKNVVLPLGQKAALAHTLQEISHDSSTCLRVLDYQTENGYQQHREIAASWLKQFHIEGNSEQIAITNGVQHALACILRILSSPGDTIVCESINYPGLISLAHQMHLHLVGVAMDDEGLIPESLEHVCHTFHPRILFCIPTLHNPTTAIMSIKRRQQIAELVERYNLNVIEDGVTSLILREQLPTLASFLPERVFFITGFSKSISAGLRVGFVKTPKAWSGKLAAVLRTNCWMASPLNTEVICRWITEGTLTLLLEQQRQALNVRQKMVSEHFVGLNYRHHPESNHVWLLLPAVWHHTTLSNLLLQHNILVKTVDLFTVGRTKAPSAIRLCLSSESCLNELQNGLKLIVDVLQQKKRL
ncbi:PLP-dependent aminotransferase family protein [Serratia sp. S1B]|nr:PLP-dependent aminotransferase family protein [Serratia sp. S1B]